mmetsp:Transcript_37449/g.43595  ORF Transcript_37449/g.43595 Transcript_37449/m.43595 type:complete len:664 (-) Transcript_37449:132-2123(-)
MFRSNLFGRYKKKEERKIAISTLTENGRLFIDDDAGGEVQTVHKASMMLNDKYEKNAKGVVNNKHFDINKALLNLNFGPTKENKSRNGYNNTTVLGDANNFDFNIDTGLLQGYSKRDISNNKGNSSIREKKNVERKRKSEFDMKIQGWRKELQLFVRQNTDFIKNIIIFCLTLALLSTCLMMIKISDDSTKKSHNFRNAADDKPIIHPILKERQSSRDDNSQVLQTSNFIESNYKEAVIHQSSNKVILSKIKTNDSVANDGENNKRVSPQSDITPFGMQNKVTSHTASAMKHDDENWVLPLRPEAKGADSPVNSKALVNKWSDMKITEGIPENPKSSKEEDILPGDAIRHVSNTRSNHGGGDTSSKTITDLDMPHVGSSIPTWYSIYSDLTEGHEDTDTILYWHIPRSAGTTMQDLFSHCIDLVEASQIGISGGHENDKELQTWSHESNGNTYVNVDTSSPGGIEKATSWGLVESGLADIIYTPFLYEASAMFQKKNRGRLVAIFRHPIERAESIFYYLQNASWEPTYDKSFKDMTLEQYVVGKRVESNWITRFLVNKRRGELTLNDLLVAKEVLRRKFLVGLISQFDDTVVRFESYFSLTLNAKSRGCQNYLINMKGDNKNNHRQSKKGSEAWDILFMLNQYDIQLYEYAEQLFVEQADLVS